MRTWKKLRSYKCITRQQELRADMSFREYIKRFKYRAKKLLNKQAKCKKPLCKK